VTGYEVNRVNWLRAKARYQRWHEEVLILEHEMIWTQKWFSHQKKIWEDRMHQSASGSKPGHRSYAAKQVGIWSEFWECASKEFEKIAKHTE
jgi:hypothetical protein